MNAWIINNIDEARKALKRVFFNLFENDIVFDDASYMQKEARRRYSYFESVFNFPYGVNDDLKALKYIEENTEKILNNYGVNFPCAIIVPSNNCSIGDRFNIINISNDFSFPYRCYKNSLNLEEIKDIFSNKKVEISFFENETYIPITFEQLEIILKKSFNRSIIMKNKNKLELIANGLSATLILKDKEENVNG